MEDIITLARSLMASPEGVAALLAIGGTSVALIVSGIKRLVSRFTATKVGGFIVIGILFVVSNLGVLASAFADLIPHLSGTRWAIYVPALMGAASALREFSKTKAAQAILSFLSMQDIRGYREYKAQRSIMTPVADLGPVAPLPVQESATSASARPSQFANL